MKPGIIKRQTNVENILQSIVYPGAFFDFYLQVPPQSWAVRNGAVLSNVSNDYPALLAELQITANAWKCKTVAEWNALSTVAGGVGGVPFFVLDTSADTIKLPDTRGDFERGSGHNSQQVGQWQRGTIMAFDGNKADVNVFALSNCKDDLPTTAMGMVSCDTIIETIDAGLRGCSVPASSIAASTYPNQHSGLVRPRNFATLPCVYIGGN